MLRFRQGISRPVMLLCAVSLFLAGCTYRYAIPDSIDQEVDRTVAFQSLLADPDAHQGRIIPLGGIILKARNLKEGTQIEVLHLPLDRYDRPVGPLTESRGRFLVLHPDYLDTAVLQRGRKITVVVEVIGKKTGLIDEAEYTYPYLKARFIHIWPAIREDARYYRPYYPYDYYYPWAPYGYPWGPPVIIVPESKEPNKRRFDPDR
jgi:outer membrane lipoprotein